MSIKVLLLICLCLAQFVKADFTSVNDDSEGDNDQESNSDYPNLVTSNSSLHFDVSSDIELICQFNHELNKDVDQVIWSFTGIVIERILTT